MTRTDIYLVDDNDAFRSSTAWLLESAGFRVNEFASGPALLEALSGSEQAARCSCLLSDVRMPGMSGLELQDELRDRGVELPLVFITAHGDVPLAVEAMRKGAVDFLEKPFSDELIFEAIDRALAAQSKRSMQGADAKIAALTPRERQVLDLVVAGTPNKLIAWELGISIKTVELHRSNMKAKLGVRTVQDLMKLVLGRPE